MQILVHLAIHGIDQRSTDELFSAVTHPLAHPRLTPARQPQLRHRGVHRRRQIRHAVHQGTVQIEENRSCFGKHFSYPPTA
ncbi:hypothetical protein D9M69_718640 [compost metagenome]